MTRLHKLLLVIAALFLFPIAPRTAFIETELTYRPMSAKGSYSFVPYLGGVGQINLVNGNVMFGRQVAGRPGRAGFGLDLSLNYNSMIWKRTGDTQMGIDEPGSRVGLGWRISLPYLVHLEQETPHLYSLVMPDGSSHEIQQYDNGSWKSVDSTYILLHPDSSTREAILKGGTKLIFGHTVGSTSYVTQMQDRNGNQIFATYVSGTGNLEWLIDTQNTPVAHFYYSADGMLERIHSFGTIHGDISFTYASAASISFSWPSPYTSQPPGSEEKLLTAVTMSGNGANILKQTYEYNSYGMLQTMANVVDKYGYNNQGEWVLKDTSTQQLASYYYEIRKHFDTSTMTPSWKPQIMVHEKSEPVYNAQGGSVSYPWYIDNNLNEQGTMSNPSIVVVSQSSGNEGISGYGLNYTTSGHNWSDGLVQTSQKRTSDGLTTLRTVSNVWTQDNVSKTFILNPRPTKQTTYLDNGMNPETESIYTTDGTGNVRDVITKGFNGAVLTKTTATYWHESHSNYASQNMTNLVATISTKNASDVEIARTETKYDDYSTYSLANCSEIVNHDNIYDVNYTLRGNPTISSRRYIEQSRMISSYVQYDIAGNVVKTKDPKGNESSTVYSGPFYGFPQSATNALNQTSFMTWQYYGDVETPGINFWRGGVSSKTDVNGVTNPTAIAYDWLGRKIAEYTLTDTVMYAHNDIEYLSTVNSASGTNYLSSNSTGNALESRASVPAETDIVQTATYDGHGRVVSKSTPHRDGGSSQTQTNAYDALGRPLTVNPPTGGQISYLYVGNTTQATDQDGKKKLNYYNEAGKVIKVVEENANGSIDVNNPDYTTTYQYDLLGRLTQVVQGVQTRSYTYDSLGRKTSETNPESGTSLFVYDDNGNMTQKTDARGIVTSYYYDALNRLILTGYSDSTMWSVNAYDETTSGLIGLIMGGKGRLTSSWTLAWNGQSFQPTAESVGYSWTYDENGRVLQQVMWMDGVTYPVSYNYTEAGCGCAKKDLQSITYPYGIAVNYAHDTIGRLTSITGKYYGNTDVTYVSGITYGSQSGGVSQIAYGAGTDTFTYEDSGRLQSIDINLPYGYGYNNRQATLAYTYSLANRITQINETTNVYPYSVNHTYEYDRWGRLISETGQFNNTWSYDRYNNLSGVANPANNRLLAFINNYDAAGNQLLDASNSYQYDARNLMKQATRLSDNLLIQYRYDSLGRKVKKTYSGGGAVYVYGTNNEILLESGNARWTYNVYLGSKLVGKRMIAAEPAVDKVQWLHRNHREEVIYTQTWDRTLTQYGCQWSPGYNCLTTSDNLYTGAFGQTGGGSDQFPGNKVDDQTGLKDFGARNYGPSAMRWYSADRLTTHFYDPQSLNKYAYSRNNPINHIDIDGNQWVEVCTQYGGVATCGNVWIDDPEEMEYNSQVDFTDFYARSSLYWYAFAYGYQPPPTVDTTSGGGGGTSFTDIVISEKNTLIDVLNAHVFSGICQSFFSDLGINFQDFVNKVYTVTPVDASASNTPFNSSTWSSDPSWVQWANNYLAGYKQPNTITVAAFFANVPTVTALSLPYGDNIFIANSNYMTWSVLAHEVVHKFNNLGDEDIQGKLGIPVNDKDTSNITREFVKRCGT